MTGLLVLQISDGLRDALRRILQFEDVETSEKEAIAVAISSSHISVSLLRKACNVLVAKDASFSLEKVAMGSKLSCPSLMPSTASSSSSTLSSSSSSLSTASELQKRREYLKLRQQDREYNQMVYGQDSHPDIHDQNNLSAQFTSLKGQFTISANMLVSIFVMYAIGYFIGRSFTENETTRMICGLVCSIGMMIVEMALFIVRAVQVERVYENTKPLSSADEAAYRPQLAVQSAFTAPDPAFAMGHHVMNPIYDDDDPWEESTILSKDSLSKKTD